MESVKVAQGQFASGRIANQEVQKVKIDLEDTRFQKAEAEQAWIDARARLEALLGTADVVPEFPWKDRIEATHAPSLDPDEVLRLRPEWIEAEREARSTDAAARSAYRALLPELTARLTYGWETTPLSAVDPAGLVSTWNSGWTGALTVTIPLFNGFRDYGGYGFLAETARATESRMEGIKRDVLAETRAVPSRYEIARKTALDREAILRTSKQLYQDNLSRFRQGRATSDELNVDLNRYLKTQLGAISGWVAAHQAYVSLQHLRGVCATDCGGKR
jgi:outer membrane protein TolC